MTRRNQEGYTAIEFLVALWIPVFLVSVAGYVTHVVTCIQEELWLLLIAGCIAFPVGIIHGIGHWFGVW